jgi:serine/threonine protein phosphatase 1
MLGVEQVFLKGNHEDAMLGFLEDSAITREWLMYGGDATLLSYGIELDRQRLGQPDGFEHLRQRFIENVPPSHVRFLKETQLYYSFGDYFFVHAGVNPKAPLDAQKENDLLWIRDAFLQSDKLYDKIIVHGHSIAPRPDIRSNRIGIDTGAYATGILTCLILKDNIRRFISTAD